MIYGVFPTEYVLEPHKWSETDAYQQMDRFTYEEFLPGELTFAHILLPPLKFEGRRLKGLFWAPGVDPIWQLVPSLPDNFISIANSRWASYPWSGHADGYFVLYKNERREAYFRNRRPDLAHVTLVPRQTADHTSERQYRPRPEIEKDIDVLVVSRLSLMKHLPFLAKSILALRKRNPAKRYHVFWANPAKGEQWRRTSGRTIMQEIARILGNVEDYIELAGRIEPADMSALYARARSFVLTSTVEGKNRAMSEALLCDVPAVVPDDFNAAARNGQPLLPPNCGLTPPRDPELFAAALEQVVESYGDFSPRAEYLKVSGRMNFFWDCVLSFEHFSSQIPGTTLEERQRWLDAAIEANYGISLVDFLYGSQSKSPVAERHGRKSLNQGHDMADIRALFELFTTL